MNSTVKIEMDEILAFAMLKTIYYLKAEMTPDEVKELTKSITNDPKLLEITTRMVKVDNL